MLFSKEQPVIACKGHLGAIKDALISFRKKTVIPFAAPFGMDKEQVFCFNFYVVY